MNFHHCVSNFKSFTCETCDQESNDAEVLFMHAMEHRQTVVHLQPGKPILTHDNELCSSECQSKSCHRIARSKVASIRAELSKLSKSKLHQYLLSRLENQKELGLDSRHSYVFQSEVFCHESAQVLLNISQYLIKQVVKEHISGKVNHFHGNFGNVYLSEKRNRALSFISQFSRTFSENLPDKQVTYLNVTEMFKNYTESVPGSFQLKKRSFFQVFKTNFGDVSRVQLGLPRVTFMPRHSHPICAECDQVNTLRKVARNESEILYANQRKMKHMTEIRQKYVQFCERRELAVRFPEDYIHLGLDDIDQTKMKTPYALQNTKTSSGMLKLDNHCTGVIVTNGKFAGLRT